MRIHQGAILTADPSGAMQAATKQYVDAQIHSGAMAPVFITNIRPTSTGSVGNKTYVANTVPANKVITAGTTNTADITLDIMAEGPGSFYSPTLTVTTDDAAVTFTPSNGIVALNEDTYDKRLFSGSISLQNVTRTTVITVTSSSGAIATATINIAAAGPQIISLSMGANPGSQTELKAGDVITVSGVVENSAVSAQVLNYGVSSSIQSLSLGSADSGGVGFKIISGNITVGSATGSALQLKANATNILPTTGADFITTGGGKTLNQTYPVIGARTITYPASQSAIKNAETANVNASVTVANGTLSVTYSSPTGELTPSNSSTYELDKTVTRASGNYNIATNNYRITATRVENGAVTVANSVVRVVNVAPTVSITISGSPARLRSSLSGNDYTVNIVADQDVGNNLPTLTASSGTWQGAAWTGGPTNFARTLRITDGNPTGSQNFNTLAITGRSGLVGNTISSGSNYVVGGFIRRTITMPALSQEAPIGTYVTDFTKVHAWYTGAAELTRRTDTGDYFQGFTITNGSGTYTPTGNYIWITDVAFAGANTSGTLQVDIEEYV